MFGMTATKRLAVAYGDLCRDDSLRLVLNGGTTNSNESFHRIIWSLCNKKKISYPKTCWTRYEFGYHNLQWWIYWSFSYLQGIWYYSKQCSNKNVQNNRSWTDKRRLIVESSFSPWTTTKKSFPTTSKRSQSDTKWSKQIWSWYCWLEETFFV
jgi:hypothetical protein